MTTTAQDTVIRGLMERSDVRNLLKVRNSSPQEGIVFQTRAGGTKYRFVGRAMIMRKGNTMVTGHCSELRGDTDEPTPKVLIFDEHNAASKYIQVEIWPEEHLHQLAFGPDEEE